MAKQTNTAKQTVLIPLDGSSFSEQILAHVRYLLSPDKHRLTLFRVGNLPQPQVSTPDAMSMQPPDVGGEEIGIGQPQVSTPDAIMQPEDATVNRPSEQIHDKQVWSTRQHELEDELRSITDSLLRDGFDVDVAARLGDAAAKIVEYAREQDVAMIAMTTHGRSGLSRLLLGSVAEDVIKNAGIPVMVLRPEKIEE